LHALFSQCTLLQNYKENMFLPTICGSKWTLYDMSVVVGVVGGGATLAVVGLTRSENNFMLMLLYK
jgi:hypothetical protein